MTLPPPPPDRREFLRRSAAGASAALLWPKALEAWAARLRASVDGPGREPGRSPDRSPASDFWDLVRTGFLIPDDRLYLNVGTLGPQPRVVLDAAVENMRRTAMTYPPGVDWDRLKGRLGRFVDGDPAGFVFPRNTTEGMNFVANGLELGPGDEVLTTDHEHIGGLCCWQLIAKRRGVMLRQLPLPVPPADAGEVVDLFRRAVTPRTRVISISHLTFTTGLVTPIAELVRMARARGIVTVVDGAHPPGCMRMSLSRLDPDFYASSPHKWLLAPQGTGFLWMREEWRTKLWPTLASGDWDDVSLGAQRFNHLGTFDESRLAGLDAALRFQDAIGIDRVEARARELRRRLIDGLAADPRVRIVSPPDDSLGAGMVSFSVQGLDSLELQQRLAAKANVRTRVIGEYGYGWMRLSPHIYNSPAEIDRVVELIGLEADRP